MIKAIGHTTAELTLAENALIALETETPQPRPHDLLVELLGVSVNPVDAKLRANVQPKSGPRISGFDAAGVVTAELTVVKRFQPMDEVFYAGILAHAQMPNFMIAGGAEPKNTVCPQLI